MHVVNIVHGRGKRAVKVHRDKSAECYAATSGRAKRSARKKRKEAPMARKQVKRAPYQRISEDHPIWTTSELLEPMWETLPPDLLRWFGCDVAEHNLQLMRSDATEPWTIHREKEYQAARECIRCTRQYLLNDEAVFERAMHAARCKFSDIPSSGQWRLFSANIHIQSRHPHEEYDSLFLADNSDEQMSRLAWLRYLCQAWNTCGERTLWLLHEGKCPLPPP